MRWLIVVTVVGALAAACGSAAVTTPTSQPAPAESPAPAGSMGVETILATTVLRTGSQRVSFLLATAQSLVRAPAARVATTHLDGDASGQAAQAKFHEWPFGVRGAFSTELRFDEPGRWRIDVAVDYEGTERTGEIIVDVADVSEVPDIGMLPPFASNKTLADVDRIEELTSDPTPDPELYLTTIPEAIITQRPTVVVFATPALCTSPTCGPQVDTVTELRAAHVGEANFIHVETYENPADIQGDLDRAIYSPLVEAWGFTTQPEWFNESWTYILGADGRITHRFEGFVSLVELEAALAEVL